VYKKKAEVAFTKKKRTEAKKKLAENGVPNKKKTVTRRKKTPLVLRAKKDRTWGEEKDQPGPTVPTQLRKKSKEAWLSPREEYTAPGKRKKRQ